MAHPDEGYKNLMKTEGEKNKAANPQLPEGVVWSIINGSYEGKYLKATCSRCKNEITSTSHKAIFIHCGKREEAPKELRKEYKRITKSQEVEPIPVPRMASEVSSQVIRNW